MFLRIAPDEPTLGRIDIAAGVILDMPAEVGQTCHAHSAVKEYRQDGSVAARLEVLSVADLEQRGQIFIAEERLYLLVGLRLVDRLKGVWRLALALADQPAEVDAEIAVVDLCRRGRGALDLRREESTDLRRSGRLHVVSHAVLCEVAAQGTHGVEIGADRLGRLPRSV